MRAVATQKKWIVTAVLSVMSSQIAVTSDFGREAIWTSGADLQSSPQAVSAGSSDARRPTSRVLGLIGEGDAAVKTADRQTSSRPDVLPTLIEARKAPEDLVRHFPSRGAAGRAFVEKTDSTVLSVGLNNKGKPGLWLVKRIS